MTPGTREKLAALYGDGKEWAKFYSLDVREKYQIWSSDGQKIARKLSAGHADLIVILHNAWPKISAKLEALDGITVRDTEVVRDLALFMNKTSEGHATLTRIADALDKVHA